MRTKKLSGQFFCPDKRAFTTKQNSNPEGSILYLPVATSGKLFQLQSGRSSQNRILPYNPFPIGTCQCNCLHGVRWCQQIAEPGWRSQWTLSRQYSPLHYQLYCSALHVTTLTADSGEDCTVWIESTVTSTLPLLSVGTSEHRGGNCTGRCRLGTG